MTNIEIAALVVGYAALFCSATYRIPQFRKLWKTKSTAGISQQMYIWQNMSYVLSIAYGVLRHDHVYIVTSTVLMAMNLVLHGMVRYYHAREMRAAQEEQQTSAKELPV
jgi:uncharacterized protein with PQ loop repeat